jgi:hypothetical protein
MEYSLLLLLIIHNYKYDPIIVTIIRFTFYVTSSDFFVNLKEIIFFVYLFC